MLTPETLAELREIVSQKPVQASSAYYRGVVKRLLDEHAALTAEVERLRGALALIDAQSDSWCNHCDSNGDHFRDECPFTIAKAALAGGRGGG